MRLAFLLVVFIALLSSSSLATSNANGVSKTTASPLDNVTFENNDKTLHRDVNERALDEERALWSGTLTKLQEFFNTKIWPLFGRIRAWFRRPFKGRGKPAEAAKAVDVEHVEAGAGGPTRPTMAAYDVKNVEPLSVEVPTTPVKFSPRANHVDRSAHNIPVESSFIVNSVESTPHGGPMTSMKFTTHEDIVDAYPVNAAPLKTHVDSSSVDASPFKTHVDSSLSVNDKRTAPHGEADTAKDLAPHVGMDSPRSPRQHLSADATSSEKAFVEREAADHHVSSAKPEVANPHLNENGLSTEKPPASRKKWNSYTPSFKWTFKKKEPARSKSLSELPVKEDPVPLSTSPHKDVDHSKELTTNPEMLEEEPTASGATSAKPPTRFQSFKKYLKAKRDALSSVLSSSPKQPPRLETSSKHWLPFRKNPSKVEPLPSSTPDGVLIDHVAHEKPLPDQSKSSLGPQVAADTSNEVPPSSLQLAPPKPRSSPLARWWKSLVNPTRKTKSKAVPSNGEVVEAKVDKVDEAKVDKVVEAKVDEARVDEVVKAKVDEASVDKVAEAKVDEASVDKVAEAKVDEAKGDKVVEAKVDEAKVDKVDDKVPLAG